MLKIVDLTLKINGKTLLDSINLDVSKNEYFAVIGPNGAGKTILMESIAGFKKVKGNLLLEGKNIGNLPIEKRNIGIVYQNFALFPHLSVKENIAFSLKIKKSKDIEEKINWIGKQLDISHLLERNTKNLSGGEKQKIAIARALIAKPKVLILDEPFSAIDASFKRKMIDFIKTIHKKFDLTTIHITHNFEEAIKLADRLAIITKGKIVQIGKPTQIFKNPRSEFVASFVGLENLIPITQKDDGYYLSGISIPLSTLKSFKKFAILHSDEIILSKKAVKSSARFSIEGIIKEISERDFYSSLKIDIGFIITAKITNKSLQKMDLHKGSKIFVTFKESSLRFI